MAASVIASATAGHRRRTTMPAEPAAITATATASTRRTPSWSSPANADVTATEHPGHHGEERVLHQGTRPPPPHGVRLYGPVAGPGVSVAAYVGCGTGPLCARSRQGVHGRCSPYRWAVSSLRRGYLMGIAAYVGWGFFPLYFKLLEPASPDEILAHRIVWSAVFMAVLLAVLRRYRFLRDLVRRPRRLAGVGLAAVLIAGNWFGFIYGVDTSRVVEISLGYFITPLVSVLLGVVVLRERLRPAAVGGGRRRRGGRRRAGRRRTAGRRGWRCWSRSASASYGLVKKRLGLPAAEGMFVESAAARCCRRWPTSCSWRAPAPPRSGRTSVGAHRCSSCSSGVLTALPLMSFADAANRIPLTALGTLQYIAPVLQLAFGVLVFHEPMPPARLAGVRAGMAGAGGLHVGRPAGQAGPQNRRADANGSRGPRSAGAATNERLPAAERPHEHPREHGQQQRAEPEDRRLTGGVGAADDPQQVDGFHLVGSGCRRVGRGHRSAGRSDGAVRGRRRVTGGGAGVADRRRRGRLGLAQLAGQAVGELAEQLAR